MGCFGLVWRFLVAGLFVMIMAMEVVSAFVIFGGERDGCVRERRLHSLLKQSLSCL